MAAMLLVLAALVMKMIVPAGYMVAAEGGRTTIVFCHGIVPAPMAAMPHHHPKQDRKLPGDERPCAFAALSAPSTAGADPVLLADAIGFVVDPARRITPTPATWTSPSYLTPPLRGPPPRV